MLGLGGPKRPRAVAFDIIGTVFPLEPLRGPLVALGLAPSALEGWFAAGCRDAFALAATGDFEPFTTVFEGALEQFLAQHGSEVSPHDRKAFVRRMEDLGPRQGAHEAFSILRDTDVQVIALSNGAKSSTRKLLSSAELDNLVDVIVSVEEVKLAKPRAEVYAHAAEKAGVAPDELALVAVHPWDIHGGAAAGLVTAFLTADGPFSPAMRKPDLRGDDLADLARKLAAL
jgi:2-haloacid dehalogenase